MTRADKQKKSLFASRTVYWIMTKPEGWMVCRKRSDFDWLSSQVGSPITEVKDQSDAEKLLTIVNKQQALFRDPFVQAFFSCSNRKQFDEKLKSAKSAKKRTGPSLQSTANQLLDALDIKAKSVRLAVVDTLGHVEDACGLLEQLAKKLVKVGDCFGRLHTDWFAIEKLDTDSRNANLLSTAFADLKIKSFEWSNSLEKQRVSITKAFLSGEGLVSQLKELRKNLKIRREASESQLHLANEICLAQLSKLDESMEASCGQWLKSMSEAALVNVAMENLRIAAKREQSPDQSKRNRRQSDNFT